MVIIEFQSADLASLRFATSPLFELWQSIRALQSPTSRALHLPWIATTAERVRQLDLSLLYALQPPQGLNPDFIHPPPTMPLTGLDDEINRVLSTPSGQIRADLACCYGDALPAVLKPFVAHPRQALAELAARLRAYWDLAIAPYWDRIRAVLEGEILYRVRSAEAGMHKVFAEIDDSVNLVGHRLEIMRSWDGEITLDGRGLLLVPSVFIWPRVAIIDQEPLQPTLIYPARGGALLWAPSVATPDALAALIGPRRAAVLSALDAPRSTTELAHLLQVLPGSVSQHLSVLQDAGLITRHRVGRLVLYRRSAKGDLLADGDGTISA